LVICFAIGFYVVADWQEPTEAPPEGNAPTPLNISDTAQTKEGNLTINGVLSTLQDMLVNLVTIKGDGSVSTNLNADKLDDYNAADLMAQAGDGYEECYVLNIAGNVDCDTGYTAVLTTTGSGCTHGFQNPKAVAGMGLWRTRHTSSISALNCDGINSDRAWECLDIFDGVSGRWQSIGAVACFYWTPLASTVGLCCK